MGVLVKCKFDGTKTSYPSETEFDNNQKALLKSFMAAHTGVVFYKYFMDAEEVNFNKKFPSFYRKIMLPPLFEKSKNDFGITQVSELDAILSLFFLKVKRKKSDGTEYEIPLRVEDLDLNGQIDFIAKVANLALTRYQIKYPNANEINQL